MLCLSGSLTPSGRHLLKLLLLSHAACVRLDLDFLDPRRHTEGLERAVFGNRSHGSPLCAGLEHNVFDLRSPEQERPAGSPGCGRQNGLRRLLNSSRFMRFQTVHLNGGIIPAGTFNLVKHITERCSCECSFRPKSDSSGCVSHADSMQTSWLRNGNGAKESARHRHQYFPIKVQC